MAAPDVESRGIAAFCADTVGCGWPISADETDAFGAPSLDCNEPTTSESPVCRDHAEWFVRHRSSSGSPDATNATPCVLDPQGTKRARELGARPVSALASRSERRRVRSFCLEGTTCRNPADCWPIKSHVVLWPSPGVPEVWDGKSFDEAMVIGLA